MCIRYKVSKKQAKKRGCICMLLNVNDVKDSMYNSLLNMDLKPKSGTFQIDVNQLIHESVLPHFPASGTVAMIYLRAIQLWNKKEDDSLPKEIEKWENVPDEQFYGLLVDNGLENVFEKPSTHLLSNDDEEMFSKILIEIQKGS